MSIQTSPQYPLTASIIICTRNRPADLLCCLSSLSIQTFTPHEIIVIDSSTQPVQETSAFSTYFNSYTFPHSTLVYQHTSPGLTYQRNRGIREAQGDVLYFFDDDVILSPTYLQTMHHIFCEKPEYGGGMGTITNIPAYTLRPTRIVRKLFLLQRDYDTGYFTWSGMPTHTYGTSQFKDIEVAGGCCMAFRASLCKKYAFDEKLPLYGAMEDCDFSWRVSREQRLFYNPKAQLEHHPSKLNRDNIEANRAMYIEHYTYLFFKNIYPQARYKIIGYLWSILGLYIEAVCIRRSYSTLKGYTKGLVRYYYNRNL